MKNTKIDQFLTDTKSPEENKNFLVYEKIWDEIPPFDLVFTGNPYLNQFPFVALSGETVYKIREENDPSECPQKQIALLKQNSTKPIVCIDSGIILYSISPIEVFRINSKFMRSNLIGYTMPYVSGEEFHAHYLGNNSSVNCIFHTTAYPTLSIFFQKNGIQPKFNIKGNFYYYELSDLGELLKNHGWIGVDSLNNRNIKVKGDKEFLELIFFDPR